MTDPEGGSQDAMALCEPSEAIGEFCLLRGWPLKPITFFLYGDHKDD